MADGVARVYVDSSFYYHDFSSSIIQDNTPMAYVSYLDDADGIQWTRSLLRFDLTPVRGRIPTRVSGEIYINLVDIKKGTGGKYFIWASRGNVGTFTTPIPTQGTVLAQGSAAGWVTLADTEASNLEFNGYYTGLGISCYIDNYNSFHEKALGVEINALSTTNKPYLDIEYNFATPRPTNQFPTSGFVNDKADKTFGWGISADNIIGTMTQGAAKFRWRPAGTTPYTEIDITGTTNRYTVSANTFPEGSGIEWQVQVQSSDGVWSDATQWFTLTTIDSISNAAPVSPKNVYIQTDQDQVFAWEHMINTGTESTGADLQYQISGGTWTIFATVAGTNAKSATVPAGTLPAGNILWRVRTYNSDGVAGTWSESAAIVGKGSPGAPAITGITNAARPRVSWQSLGQIAFQLQLLQSTAILFDTGETAGIEKQYSVTEYLPDDPYTVRIRIKNTDQIWSSWTSLDFSIATTKPTAPTVTAIAVSGGAKITVTTDETVVKRYLLRNGIPIAKIADSYTDYAALGETTYTARAVSADDSFIDSDPVTVKVTVPYAVLAAVDDLDNMVGLIVKSGEPPTHSGKRQLGGSARHYAGRTFPLYTFSGFTDETFSPSYTYRDPVDWERLERLIERRQTVLYRDRRGERYYGVITAVDYDRSRILRDFTLSITRVDYVEQTQYDTPEV